MKQIQITMPDGSVWAVPAELVARDRADHYGGQAGEESWKAEHAATLADHAALLDWAENNLNWADVAHAAILIRPGSVDFQEGWVNGPKRVVESANGKLCNDAP